jgi:pyrophosphorylase
MKNVGVLLAGGSGTRMHTELPKQFLVLAGKTLLQHAIDTFSASSAIDEMCVVLPQHFIQAISGADWFRNYAKPIRIVEGGTSRTHSSYNAFSAYRAEHRSVNLLYHDAARALLSIRDLENVISALELYDGVVLGTPVVDTIYELDESKTLQRIPEREHLWCAQTPQAFRGVQLAAAFTRWEKKGAMPYSDDVSLVKAMLPNIDIHLVESQDFNMKITTSTDMLVAESFLCKKI